MQQVNIQRVSLILCLQSLENGGYSIQFAGPCGHGGFCDERLVHSVVKCNFERCGVKDLVEEMLCRRLYWIAF